MTTIIPKHIRPTKTPRYFAASHTANFDSYGFFPELTCSHVHRTYKKAAACATRMSWTWVVYKQLNGRITRAEDRNEDFSGANSAGRPGG
jgi:hypothetical protein